MFKYSGMKNARFLSLAILFSFLMQTAFTRPVTKASADLVARNFLLSQGIAANLKSTGNGPVCQPFGNILLADGSYSEYPAFYIYNSEKPGFVIISGVDAVTPILAYSRDNHLDISHMPPGADMLLKDYETEINYVVQKNMEASPTVKAEWENLIHYQGELKSAYAIDSVKPMTTTKWGYGAPYNNLCPQDPKASVKNGGRCPVGCAAVAMAQIMKYWDNIQKTKVNLARDIWYRPLRGYGTNSYASNYGTLSADFGNTVYQWFAMWDVVTNTSPEKEKLAVATLMYHCGISVNMEYTYNSSGCYFDCLPEPLSYTNCVKKAFEKYWGYDSAGIKAYVKSFSDSLWKEMIKKEIIAGRPVLYAGEDAKSGAGHAMVIDGLNKAGMFHFNYGLYGDNDGWYLPSLIPLPVSATETWNMISNAMIMTGIQPDHTVCTGEIAKDSQLKIWPNPATDRLHIDLGNSGTNQVEVEIINSTGMKVAAMNYSGPPAEIPLDNLNPGVYFIRANSGNKQMTEKFVIR